MQIDTRMFALRSSIVTVYNTTSTVTYSTLRGSTITSISKICSTIGTNTLVASYINYSTLTGSTINTPNITVNNAIWQSFTLTQTSSIVTSTLNNGANFTITNGANTGTISTIAQYPVDISETTRASALVYADNSSAITVTSSLDYTKFGQNWTIVNGLPLTNWAAAAMSASGQYQTV